MHWRTKDIPELKDLTPAQRQEVWARVAPRAFCKNSVWPVLIVAGALGGAGGALGGALVPNLWGLIIGCAIGSGLGGTVFWFYAVPRMRPMLAAERSRMGLGQASDACDIFDRGLK